MLQKVSSLILMLCLLISFVTQGEELSIETFSQDAQYSEIKLSPEGDYLAGITMVEGKRVLFTFSLAEQKLLYALKFGQNAQAGSYHWASNERLVLEKQYLKGWQDHPVYHGEIFGVNVDGSQGKYLVGYQGRGQTGSRIKKGATPLYGTSYVLDPLHDDPDNILIVTYPWNGSNEPYTRIYRVDINKGKRKKVTRAPVRMAQYLTDHQGQVRAAVSSSDYIDQQLYIRDLKARKWDEFTLEKQNFTNIDLIAFDQSGESVYVSASKSGEPEGIYKMSLANKEIKLIHQDGTVDPMKIWVDDASKEIFAIEYEDGYPSYSFVDPKSVMSQRLKALLSYFEGNQVQIVSSTQDGNLNVVRTISDINPGEYYLYDAKKSKVQFLFASRQWVKKELMAQSQPISFTARDGVKVHGYLTLPEGKKHKNLPLVVMPHGGPHGPRDYWEYDSEVQLLASRGIAVLKVNFRGSGGYGPNFEFMGHRKWGKEIQFDIIDGVKHVIKEGIADKDNMCIMGASFGGYSALQSSILEPDMFKCAVGVVGVYDLPMMFKEGDVSERESGQKYLKEVLGEDQAQLKAFSPSYNIDKLKAPVLIVHGGDDERAPIEQAESLIKALDKHKHPYEYELLENEGHGFYKPEHRTRYYKKVLAFLDKHMTL